MSSSIYISPTQKFFEKYSCICKTSVKNDFTREIFSSGEKLN